mmetsp:Transcript_6543/g.18088  ORF Transcript_6543/g.18088 Transcript_6543/m.18088 type:complete len:270 (-) Transcript_6543:212-1021(-)
MNESASRTCMYLSIHRFIEQALPSLPLLPLLPSLPSLLRLGQHIPHDSILVVIGVRQRLDAVRQLGRHLLDTDRYLCRQLVQQAGNCRDELRLGRHALQTLDIGIGERVSGHDASGHPQRMHGLALLLRELLLRLLHKFQVRLDGLGNLLLLDEQPDIVPLGRRLEVLPSLDLVGGVLHQRVLAHHQRRALGRETAPELLHLLDRQSLVTKTDDHGALLEHRDQLADLLLLLRTGQRLRNHRNASRLHHVDRWASSRLRPLRGTHTPAR